MRFHTYRCEHGVHIGELRCQHRAGPALEKGCPEARPGRKLVNPPCFSPDVRPIRGAFGSVILGKESATEVRNVPTFPQKLNLSLQVSEI